MKVRNKHLVYIEDVIYEIMQYPNGIMTKKSIRDCIEKVREEKSISIWKHIWNVIKGWFVK